MRHQVLFAISIVFCLVAAGNGRAEDEGFVGVQVKKVANGIEVSAVIGDSPAEKAGFRSADLIRKMNGDDVEDLTLADFVKKILGTKPGEKIKFALVRDGKEMEITVTVGKKPAP